MMAKEMTKEEHLKHQPRSRGSKKRGSRDSKKRSKGVASFKEVAEAAERA